MDITAEHISRFHTARQKLQTLFHEALRYEFKAYDELWTPILNGVLPHHHTVLYRHILGAECSMSICTFDNAVKVMKFESVLSFVRINNTSSSTIIDEHVFANVYLRPTVNLAWSLNCTTSELTICAIQELFGLEGTRTQIKSDYTPHITSFEDLCRTLRELKQYMNNKRSSSYQRTSVRKNDIQNWKKEKEASTSSSSESISNNSEDLPHVDKEDVDEKSPMDEQKVAQILKEGNKLISVDAVINANTNTDWKDPRGNEYNKIPTLPELPTSIIQDRNALLTDYTNKSQTLVDKYGGITIESFVNGPHELKSLTLSLSSNCSNSYVKMCREDWNIFLNSPIVNATLLVAITS
jgi:hypothetical protein